MIGVGLHAETECRYCSLFHTEAAKLFGATDEEIQEAGHSANAGLRVHQRDAGGLRPARPGRGPRPFQGRLMELERVRPLVVRGTFHAYELAALVATARYVVGSAPAEVFQEAFDQLTRLLADYDQQVREPATP